MAKNLERVMNISFFSDILISCGPNYKKNMLMKMDRNMRLTVPWIKKFKRTDTAFFDEKKRGSVFFTFFIQAMVWSQIVIHHRVTFSCLNFSRIGPLEIKIFEILNHIGF